MTTRFLRSDATSLTAKDVQDIIDARGSMKYAAQVMAEKYHISPRRVYQIWRNKQPQMDNSYKAGNDSITETVSSSVDLMAKAKASESLSLKKHKTKNASQSRQKKTHDKKNDISNETPTQIYSSDTNYKENFDKFFQQTYGKITSKLI